MEPAEKPKFWLIQNFDTMLTNTGIPDGMANIITFIAACIIIALLIWIIDIIGTKVVLLYIKRGAKKTKTKWDDYLYRRRFFHRAIRLVPAVAFLYFINVIFQGYDTQIVGGTQVIMRCLIVFMMMVTITAFLDAANDVYDSRSKEKSIKGFIQTAKIAVWIVGVITVISLLLDENPGKLLVGLGASAAIITLVFKDTILGFVSAIQLSAQDMVRRGDWITVPAHNADGIVQEITLTTVKVQNWDNTVTMVPIYAMVNQSFTNWRDMQESAGRRIKRQIHLDITSSGIITEGQLRTICENEYVAPLAGHMLSLMRSTNTSPFTSNFSLYRAYVEVYINNREDINKELLLTVRYLPQSDTGVILELYAFTIDRGFYNHEKIAADILDHVMTLAPTFGIRLFQRSQGTNIADVTIPDAADPVVAQPDAEAEKK